MTSFQHDLRDGNAIIMEFKYVIDECCGLWMNDG
jgi:hypothetical protein